MKKTEHKITITKNDTAARLEALKIEARELEAKLRQARGTREIAPLILEPAERVQAALSLRPATLEDLARELKMPVGRIEAEIKPLRKQLFNVGTDVAPAWFLPTGDDVPTPLLNAAVRALISHKPMTFQELKAATGARDGRIHGAIVAARETEQVVNLGTQSHGRWFLVPAGTKIAGLKSR